MTASKEYAQVFKFLKDHKVIEKGMSVKTILGIAHQHVDELIDSKSTGYNQPIRDTGVSFPAVAQQKHYADDKDLQVDDLSKPVKQSSIEKMLSEFPEIVMDDARTVNPSFDDKNASSDSNPKWIFKTKADIAGDPLTLNLSNYQPYKDTVIDMATKSGVYHDIDGKVDLPILEQLLDIAKLPTTQTQVFSDHATTILNKMSNI